MQAQDLFSEFRKLSVEERNSFLTSLMLWNDLHLPDSKFILMTVNMADKKETQADFHLIEPAVTDPRLLEIQDRASAIVIFTARMQDPHLSAEERDREMSMVRAHCKGLSEAARDYLRDNQHDWYKLDQEGRSEAIRKAFREERHQ